MRIVVMSAGAVGGYFGGRLAASGQDVVFVARGAHLEALKREGLRIESAQRGDLHLPNVTTTDSLAGLSPADLVLFAVKLWDTDAAIAAIRPVVGDETRVLTLQNGVESTDKLAAAFGTGRVWGGTAHISASIARPGVIRHIGTLQAMQMGTLDGAPSDQLRRFATACEKAGLGAEVSDRIVPLIWEKFIYLVALSGVTAVTRLPIGAIREDPEVWALYTEALAEAAAVARARGIAIAPDAEDTIVRFVRGLPSEMKASMLFDLEQGRPLELPWLSGAVVRLGAALGVDTPLHRFIWRALKLHAGGRP